MGVLIVFIGLVFFFFDDILQGIKRVSSLNLNQYVAKFYKRNIPIAHKINILKNGKKEIFIKTYYNDMVSTLNKTGEKDKLKIYRILSIICGITAGLIALYIKAYMLIPINIVGFSLIPMWIVKFKDFNYRLKVNAELSVALSVISTAYVKSNNFVSAIEENLMYINPPVKSTFANFISNYKYVDKNLDNNINAMKEKISNDVFKLWCDNIKVCLKDSNHKSSLNAVVEKLNTDRQIQDDIKKEVYKPIVNTVAIIILSACFFPLLPMFDPKMVQILLNSIIGQSIVVLYVLAVIFAIDKSIMISTKEAK